MPTLPSDRLACAAADYRWLLDRGYPDAGSLEFAGDRYRLSGTERGMLYRGVFSRVDSERRAASLADPSGSELTIDGHNVLFTLWNCLSGRPIVLATDGFVRDIGGTRSRLPHDERFGRIAGLLCRELAALGVTEVTVLLDEPLPWSRDHIGSLERVWRETAPDRPVRFDAVTEPSVDATIARTSAGMIATSDTAIIDRCAVPVVDLGGRIVTGALATRPVAMSDLCSSRRSCP